MSDEKKIPVTVHTVEGKQTVGEAEIHEDGTATFRLQGEWAHKLGFAPRPGEFSLGIYPTTYPSSFKREASHPLENVLNKEHPDAYSVFEHMDFRGHIDDQG